MMGYHQKKAFENALLTNYDSAKEFKQYVKKAKLDANITCFPSIEVINSYVSASPPYPVKLDRNLAHIKYLVGRKNNKCVPFTSLWYLIDSGVGDNIGLLNYFEGIVIINPDN